MSKCKNPEPLMILRVGLIIALYRGKRDAMRGYRNVDPVNEAEHTVNSSILQSKKRYRELM
jgi:hypothetical protein